MPWKGQWGQRTYVSSSIFGGMLVVASSLLLAGPHGRPRGRGMRKTLRRAPDRSGDEVLEGGMAAQLGADGLHEGMDRSLGSPEHRGDLLGGRGLVCQVDKPEGRSS